MNTAFNFNQLDQHHAEMLAITNKLIEVLQELDIVVKKANPVTPKFKILKGGKFNTNFTRDD